MVIPWRMFAWFGVEITGWNDGVTRFMVFEKVVFGYVDAGLEEVEVLPHWSHVWSVRSAESVYKSHGARLFPSHNTILHLLPKKRLRNAACPVLAPAENPPSTISMFASESLNSGVSKANTITLHATERGLVRDSQKEDTELPCGEQQDVSNSYNRLTCPARSTCYISFQPSGCVLSSSLHLPRMLFQKLSNPIPCSPSLAERL
jgi:hypothetical protein